MTDTKEMVAVTNDLLDKALTQQKEIGVALLEQLSAGFAPFFAEAQTLLKQSESVSVNSEADKDGMASAKKIRLALVKTRTGADKKREELKSDALRYGNAVQGMFNILKMTIEPTEKRLYDAERFIEIQEENRRLKLQEERQIQIAQYTEYVPDVSNLGKLSEDAFTKVFNGAKLQFEDALRLKREEESAVEKAELERKAKQESDRLALVEAQREAEKAKQELARKEKELIKTQKVLVRHEAAQSKPKTDEEHWERIVAKLKEIEIEQFEETINKELKLKVDSLIRKVVQYIEEKTK